MRNRIVYLLLFLCIIAGGRAEALSLEAQNAIETIRAKLNAVEAIAQPAQETGYIPGRELSGALLRLRQKLHGIEIATEPVPEATTEDKITTAVDCSSYQIGERLAAALLKVRQSQGRTESLQVAMAGIDTSVSSEPDVEPVIPEVSPAEPVVVVDEKPVAAPPAPEITKTAPDDEKVIATSDKKEIDKKVSRKNGKKSKKKRSKKPNVQVVEKKSGPVSEKTAEQPKIAASEEDDQKFNEFIKKYDFKMPENYRIIVR